MVIHLKEWKCLSCKLKAKANVHVALSVQPSNDHNHSSSNLRPPLYHLSTFTIQLARILSVDLQFPLLKRLVYSHKAGVEYYIVQHGNVVPELRLAVRKLCSHIQMTVYGTGWVTVTTASDTSEHLVSGWHTLLWFTTYSVQFELQYS